MSVITPSYNAVETIHDTVCSVSSQSYRDIEHIIVDGASDDGTPEAVAAAATRFTTLISEPDQGMYEALNKGIALSRGAIIGCLNADDVFAHQDVISRIVAEFEASETQTLFGDVVFVDPRDLTTVKRFYRAHRFHPGRLAWGWMPPHPTFYARRGCYETAGPFKTDYEIASDYEIIVRFLARYRFSYSYLPEVLVKMRPGGLSTRSFRSNLVINAEIVRACTENGLKSNHFMVWSKYLEKALQLVTRPRKGFS